MRSGEAALDKGTQKVQSGEGEAPVDKNGSTRLDVVGKGL
jgi:hypothetical protein